MTVLSRRPAVWVFLAFAFAYFFSALLRAITATISPSSPSARAGIVRALPTAIRTPAVTKYLSVTKCICALVARSA